jgi:Fe-S oxidoreductase
MDSAGDLKLARKIARATAVAFREHIDEMRKQGSIHGELTVVVKDGKKERRFPYRSSA